MGVKFLSAVLIIIIGVGLVSLNDVPAGNDDSTDSSAVQNSHDHGKMVMAETKDSALPLKRARVEEKLGKYAALDTDFKDSSGMPIKFETIFEKPVVILPIYFMCPSVCSFLQADLVRALNLVDQVPGQDFNVISLSFAHDEDPSHASAAKINYNNLITRDFPKENWFYLTGDLENILKVTNSLGFYFLKTRPNFYVHPSVLVVLAKDGKIIRYLYGPGFLPFDLGMALSEAERGQPGISIKRGVLSFCFDYDPENKTYVFKLFRITGTVILILLLGFIIFLLYPSKRDKAKKDRIVP
jgi:protein SCO1